MTTEKKNNRWTLILIITAVFAIASIGFLLVGIISRKAAEPEPTEPPATEPEVETNAIVRDLMYHEATNKQFITIETRSGEVFYIIIDYDAPTDENNEQFHTYFLNKVDDADPYLADADQIIFGPEALGDNVRLAFIIKDDAIIELYEEK